jgi:nuclear transport factor 2 (NTF2) superfamily protein
MLQLRETAAQKVRRAEDAWDSREPERLSLATEDARRRAHCRALRYELARQNLSYGLSRNSTALRYEIPASLQPRPMEFNKARDALVP